MWTKFIYGSKKILHKSCLRYHEKVFINFGAYLIKIVTLLYILSEIKIPTTKI